MLEAGILADKILDFLATKVDTNYRVAVIIVGPPGSGKTTISESVCKEINARYQQYLQCQQSLQPHLIESTETAIEVEKLCETIPFVNSVECSKIKNGCFDHVENLDYIPHRIKVDNDEHSTVVVGRGGFPNSVRLSSEKPQLNFKDNVGIAQVVPMDGFHLSRVHLDHFHDSAEAHARRGSPQTFDSNNYLQLSKILAKSCEFKPEFPSNVETRNGLFEKISASFSEKMPSIYVPGFDHALKDPVTDQHCINAFTRIIVLEGLYLLLNEENWKEVYPIFEETQAVLVWRLDLGIEQLEQRVANRHVASGLAPNYEAGVERFRMNDLINAIKIKEQSLNADDIEVLSSA
ncbi:LAME_0B02938g1_1 [Lachancea meyersii CBS 8951]|uniref:LAME_0B02938g1_1 n=1 Tax=Lachancea meyersii CBS 8951 TaxID=1266667 RepID=A0A1G4IUJ0_9SACH|nr:LAME_0B02938g1_1 [Lachancea meyersii CBS 8951]